MKSAARLGHAPGQDLRILVVDDDEVLREQLQQVLLELGHACWCARDGLEALAMHREKPFDVVLSDWRMPAMDGLELCRRMRRQERAGYTYFIFMTGLVEESSVVEALQEGADEYITKPVDIEELRARLVPAARITSANRVLVRKNLMLQRGSERAFKAARIDPLTEIGNRLRLREDLDALSARASRYGHRYCVAICDVDWFKRYNDHYGHPAGDDVLRRVVQAMRQSVRRGDVVYRYGGEEFIVILAQQSLEQAAAAMDRVRENVERLAIPHSPLAHAVTGSVVTISIGVSELVEPSEGGRTSQEWLQRADKALYRAKANGRNRVELDGDGSARSSIAARSTRRNSGRYAIIAKDDT